jgi:N-acyl-D-aspartate/D-glutamate deacylase
VREEGLLNLPEAVRRTTALPAAVFGLQRRGFIRQGFFADLVIFDYDTIKDDAIFKEPFRMSKGITHVFVNGQLSYSEGLFAGLRAGRIL